ncbi:MAG: bifunctional tetrahydrofolate synthase/dihydrofolate synthase [Gammaproteobacteria bacterium]|nr:bifunctional tetrahydrofolate synthase/dihydrofolate synthase [Gammaproteobacteria bacterium]
MRFTTLSDWLQWQETLHPAAIDLGLERVAAVWRRLYPRPFPATVITVAGTNGKGSTVAMLAGVYRAAGYRVATYTSPHLYRYNERIVINAAELDDASLCRAFETVDQARADTSLTYFEFGTLAALWLFSQATLDIVILEVGLGGRLDAVNILDADVAVITAIDLDHQAWLGADRAAIGREKAGILRSARPAVCSDPQLPATVEAYAQQIQAPLFRLNHEFHYVGSGAHWRWWSTQQQRPGLPRPALSGPHQLQNAAGVLMAVELLQTRFPVSQAQLREGLLSARVAGRFEILPGTVTTVLDVAHNPAGVRSLAASLREFPRPGKTFAVFTALADKDIDNMILTLLPLIDAWYIAPAMTPRSRSAAELQQAVLRHPVKGRVVVDATILAAYQHAHRDACPGDCIVVCGSFYAVAEASAPRV